LWGGPECTIVRIGDRWRDQCDETGHRQRISDIDLIAGLGIRTVRYPILWESLAGDAGRKLDFAWTDERLAMFEQRGIKVIAGLLHHGSGPPGTNLLDPGFPTKFAEYAGRVAQRYPHIEMWTPINEPLTTARFAALYGHWYPHRRDYPAFLRAVVNQCRAIAGAMEAIRATIPGARLVQTEDLGMTHATAPLVDQAAHENERRWLSLDLLAGRVGPTHPLYRFLVDAEITPAELAAFEQGASKPDLIGINYYLTSERFLDHRTHSYPDHEPGGNGRDGYVDVEAVRVAGLEGDIGLTPRLCEAWERYGVPLAVTEVHHGCTREEQLRWFIEVRDQCGQLRREGVDLRAFTLWSLFGNVDWRSLITREDGVYDVGAFDIRAPRPRPTAVAAAAKAFATGEPFDHPALDAPGWWRRPDRLYPWCAAQKAAEQPGHGRKLLITGATGTLGTALARIAEHRGLPFRATSRDELDLGDPRSIEQALDRHSPWAIVNAAGFVRVADAEKERAVCFEANAAGAENLARECARRELPLVSFSSDLVFDGSAGRPYRETDAVCPAGVYGASKVAAERVVAAAGGPALIVRTSAFFGPWDVHNFAWQVLNRLGRGKPVRACARTSVSPTFVPDLCHAVLDLLIDGETGIWHLANRGEISWHGFAHLLARGAGLDCDLIIADNGLIDGSTALTSERGTVMRPLDEAVAAYLRDMGMSESLQLAAE
jgi:dTDP-4-dehydrorhamnose reductase